MIVDEVLFEGKRKPRGEIGEVFWGGNVGESGGEKAVSWKGFRE